MEMLIILFAVYIIFWIASFCFAKLYIEKLIREFQAQVTAIMVMAKDYLKK